MIEKRYNMLFNFTKKYSQKKTKTEKKNKNTKKKPFRFHIPTIKKPGLKREFSLKQKFIFLAIGIILAFFITAIIPLANFSRISAYKDFNEEFSTFTTEYHLLKLQRKSLFISLYENDDFLMYGENPEVEKIREKLKKCTIAIVKLRENQVADETGMQTSLNRIDSLILRYSNYFDETIAKIYERGNQHSRKGIHGNIIRAKKAADSLTSDNTILDYLKKLDNAEKKYYTTGNYTHYEKFLEIYEGLDNYLKTYEEPVYDNYFEPDTLFTDDFTEPTNEFTDDFIDDFTEPTDEFIDDYTDGYPDDPTQDTTTELLSETNQTMPEEDAFTSDEMTTLNTTTDTLTQYSEAFDNKLINSIIQYYHAFKAYYKINSEIGSDGETGLRGKMNAVLDQIDNQISGKREQIINSLQSSIRRIIVSVFVLILLLIAGLLTYIYFFATKSVLQPIERINHYLKRVKRGELPDKKIYLKNEDELTAATKSLNSLIDSLKNAASFAIEIGKNKFDSDYTPTSEKDIIGNALVNLRDNLKTANIEEKKRIDEDKRRSWTSEGIAKFNDILRQTTDDLNEFCYHIISNLVEYIDANQGGIFLYNDENKKNIHLELMAAYAYDRRKYISKKVEPGEGLVGTCAKEQKTIHLTEIPENYIKISSGLGSSTPKSLLIVPLITEDQIIGVIELASFKEIEQYVIQFVEELAEDIALTLGATRMNQKTARLLEDFRKQSEEKAAQEEEMRQNLEELQATQEAIAQKETEMKNLWKGLNNAALITEFDLKGKILDINDAFLDLLNLTQEQIIGKHHSEFIDIKQDSLKEYNAFWNELTEGTIKKQIQHLHVFGKEIWISETYSPIYDSNGNVYKILDIAFDITEQHQQELRLKKQADEMLEKQEALKDANEKMKRGETILKRALEKAKKQEKELSKQQELYSKQQNDMKVKEEQLKECQKQIGLQREQLKELNNKLKNCKAELKQAKK